MPASVRLEQGQPLRTEELDLEPPRAGEATVRMTASGVCPSCLHAADGSWTAVPVPIVRGDEGAGVVETMGPGTTGLRAGEQGRRRGRRDRLPRRQRGFPGPGRGRAGAWVRLPASPSRRPG